MYCLYVKVKGTAETTYQRESKHWIYFKCFFHVRIGNKLFIVSVDLKNKSYRFLLWKKRIYYTSIHKSASVDRTLEKIYSAMNHYPYVIIISVTFASFIFSITFILTTLSVKSKDIWDVARRFSINWYTNITSSVNIKGVPTDSL